MHEKHEQVLTSLVNILCWSPSRSYVDSPTRGRSILAVDEEEDDMRYTDEWRYDNMSPTDPENWPMLERIAAQMMAKAQRDMDREADDGDTETC